MSVLYLWYVHPLCNTPTHSPSLLPPSPLWRDHATPRTHARTLARTHARVCVCMHVYTKSVGSEQQHAFIKHTAKRHNMFRSISHVQASPLAPERVYVRVCVCARLCVRAYSHLCESVCVCDCVCQRECVCVIVRLCVCVKERERECVCVW